MSSTSNPKINYNLIAAQLAASTGSRHDLICGSIPAAGTAVAETLYEDIADRTKSELDALFVANSDVRNRIAQFIASNQGYSKLSVQVVEENGAAVKSAGEITPTNAATEDGVLTVSLIDKEQFSFPIAVVDGETPATFIAKVVAAFSATNFPTMPVLVADGTTKVDITAIDGGTLGNKYKIEVDGFVAGLDIAITDMASGANDPVVTTFFDNLANTRFTGINWPSTWDAQVEIVKDFLDNRFNSVNAIKDGVAFVGSLDTFANNKAKALLKNSQSLVYMGNTTTVFQPADWTASYFQGVRSRRLTAGSPISQFITTTSGALDNTGGPHLASLPYFNTPLASLTLASLNDLYSHPEQIELEDSGFSTYGVNKANNGMITGKFVTTYTTDSAGNPNVSFHKLNYVDTSSICREYMFNNLAARFSQSRLTSGDLVNGYSIENEASIRSEFLKEYKQLANMVLVAKGSISEEFFKENLVLTIDQTTGTVTAVFKLRIVTQLDNIDVTAQLDFNQES